MANEDLYRDVVLDEFKIRPVDNTRTSSCIKISLLEWIYQNATESDKPYRLPSEVDLANALGISRTGLRAALAQLEGEGYITRRKNVGTLVNPRMARCRTRMDLQTEISSLIADQGYEETYKVLSIELKDGHREKLAPEENKYLEVAKLHYADGIPAIYCVDRIAGSIVGNDEANFKLFEHMNLYDFMKSFVRVQNAYSFSDVSCEQASAEMANFMNIAENAPLMHLSNVNYDMDHVPYMDSDIFIRTEIIKLSLLRRPI